MAKSAFLQHNKKYLRLKIDSLLLWNTLRLSSQKQILREGENNLGMITFSKTNFGIRGGTSLT